MPVKEVVEAGLMRRVRGRARVAKLLEVEDASLLDRIEKPVHLVPVSVDDPASREVVRR